MSSSDIIALMGVTITTIGVLVVILAALEYGKVRRALEKTQQLREDLKAELFKVQKASHLVQAAYGDLPFETKVSLLKEAICINPDTFNAYNTLGWIYLKAGPEHITLAIQAFNEAVVRHPEEKAGYFDLATAYAQSGDKTRALQYIREAIRVDPTARLDLAESALADHMQDDKTFEALMNG